MTANPKRKEAENYILKWINELAPGNLNVKLYQELFAKMSDEAFHQLMVDIRDGKRFLCFIAPNFIKPEISVERNLEVAEQLGHRFHQRLWVDGHGSQPKYLTPIKHLVVDLTLRRASQLLIKKIRIPQHNRSVDLLTNQPTNESKGAKVSYTELQVLASLGIDDAIIELIKYRGGDERGFAALNASIARYGTASLKVLQNYASGVKSTQTLKTYLNACHLSTTL